MQPPAPRRHLPPSLPQREESAQPPSPHLERRIPIARRRHDGASGCQPPPGLLGARLLPSPKRGAQVRARASHDGRAQDRPDEAEEARPRAQGNTQHDAPAAGAPSSWRRPDWPDCRSSHRIDQRITGTSFACDQEKTDITVEVSAAATEFLGTKNGAATHAEIAKRSLEAARRELE